MRRGEKGERMLRWVGRDVRLFEEERYGRVCIILVSTLIIIHIFNSHPLHSQVFFY